MCLVLTWYEAIGQRVKVFTEALREAADAQGDPKVIDLMQDLDEAVAGVDETLAAIADAAGCDK